VLLVHRERPGRLELRVPLAHKVFKVLQVLLVPQGPQVRLERKVPLVRLELLELQVPLVQTAPTVRQVLRVQQALPDLLEPQAPLVQPELTEPQVRRVSKVSKGWRVHKVVLVLASCFRARLPLPPLCQPLPLKVSPISLTAPVRCGSTTQLTPGSTVVPFKVPKAFKVSKDLRAQ
jgi:hypothetical protein